MAELTPMMQQYRTVKERNPDCILFFRLGDFYEMFDEDARIASRELDLTLTSRDHAKDKAPEDKVPMCGVPFHSSESYIARLVQKGYKVAICEQMEDPALAKGLVKRDIIRIVTPGTVTESSMLDESKNNYYACVYGENGAYGAAFCDISTGAFSATVFSGPDAEEAVCNELGSFSPTELLLGGDAETSEEIKAVAGSRLGCCMGRSREHQFDLSLCKAAVESQFEKTQDVLGLTGHDEVVIAAGALLCAPGTHRKRPSHIRALDFYVAGKFMGLDLTARRNLELTETMRTKEKKGSLLGVLDQTKTAMGGRLLRSWMERPLLSPAKIGKRLSAVQELVDKTIDREELRLSLREVSDYERVMARIVTGTANCRDLVALSQGAATLPAIHDRLETLSSPPLKRNLRPARPIAGPQGGHRKDHCRRAPFVLREGGMIRDGANEELDKLREIQNGGTGMLTAIEAREKEATGIRNLRVGYNRVFGYYIEVAKGQLNLVPDHYIRKQTLSTGERYITQELKELESTILGAKDRIVSLEYEIFTQLRAHVSEQSQRVQKTAQAIASLDVLCSFAHTAVHNHYCRPEVDLSGEIRITQGRHPVVEQMLKNTLFVPNDTVLGADGCKAAIITGPNMAGKSTYMRQVALIVPHGADGKLRPGRVRPRRHCR